MDPFILKLSEREFHTVLAALRFWQERSHDTDEFNFDEIATNLDEVEQLSDEEIDELCDRIPDL